MKKVFIVHGWEGSPQEPLHEWLKSSLEEKNYEVTVPAMPDPETPKVRPWVNKLKEVITAPDEDTILVGHSIGCQAILHYLETLPENTKIAGVVLIAPWMKIHAKTIGKEGEEIKAIARPWIETPIDFAEVKQRAGKFVAIFSDNDPYVPLDQQEFFTQNLGAKTILEHDMGHFSARDGISQLPSALEEIVAI